ncbi:MAG: universal stress protein [Betaproteobacteria bacterium]|nr:universal stress protein [Betaproteobacteria bacterium]
MYKHILIPTDGTGNAENAVRAGIEFARDAGARVTLFTAVPEYVPPGTVEYLSHSAVSLEEHERRSREKARSILDGALEQARAAGVECDSDYVQSDHPHRAIVEACKRHHCDAIFMASHARTGLAALWHGSAAIEVLTHSDVPTVVYHS